MNQSILFTILLPVYNGEKYLGKAISSVLTQSYKNWRLIIINDGSYDRTEPISKAFSSRYRNIHLLSKSNTGIADSLNKGIHYFPDTSWIARIDSDDLWHKDKLLKQYIFIKNNPGSQAVATWMNEFSDKYSREHSFPTQPEEIKNMLLNGLTFAHSSICFKLPSRKFLYRKEFARCEDIDMWLRLSNHGNIYCIPEYLTCVREHNLNVSRKDNFDKQYFDFISARIAFTLEKLLDRPLLPTEITYICYYVLRSCDKWPEIPLRRLKYYLKLSLFQKRILDANLLMKLLFYTLRYISFSMLSYRETFSMRVSNSAQLLFYALRP